MKHHNVTPLTFSLAVAACTAAYDLVRKTFRTSARPAALTACEAVDTYLGTVALGNVVEYLEEPGVFGVVLNTFDGYDFRADMYGVSCWDTVRPAKMPTTFACRALYKRTRRMIQAYKQLGQWDKVSPFASALAAMAKKELVVAGNK